MARIRRFIDPNSDPQNPREVLGEFYQRSVVSTCVLSTSFTSYNFFANTEAATLRTYNTGQNFFISNQGAILAMQLSLHGPAYAQIANYTSILSLWNQIIQLGNLTMTLDSKPNDIVSAAQLTTSVPIIQTADPNGTVAANTPIPNTPYAQPQSLYNRDALVAGKWFTPPVLVAYGRTLQFQLQMPAAVTITALSGYYIRLELALEEYPSLNPAEVRT